MQRHRSEWTEGYINFLTSSWPAILLSKECVYYFVVYDALPYISIYNIKDGTLNYHSVWVLHYGNIRECAKQNWDLQIRQQIDMTDRLNSLAPYPGCRGTNIILYYK
jgi:hypothetical protein